MITYLQLAFEFFKTGLFSIGGGLATLPFLREIALKYDWYTLDQLYDMIAISEATPGPIGINMATYAGFNTAYIGGAVIASLMIVLPSFCVACIVARFLKKYNSNKIVKGTFYILRPATTALVVSAMGQVLINSLINTSLIGTGAQITDIISITGIIFFIVILAAIILLGKRLHPIFFILTGAIIGILFKL